MLANRLRKRARHLRKWARREKVTCYRLYDRDIPEIPLSIDWYEGHLYVAVYRHRDGDASDDRGDGQDSSTQWVDAMARAAGRALEVPDDRLYVKERQRQRGSRQYERLDRSGQELIVSEGGHRFLINLRDYLDTGLFLDHRMTRARIQAEAAGRRFLNLFCYTGAFTVYAAAGGAASTVSVDLSPRYLAWGKRNVELNELAGPQHQWIRADVVDSLRSGTFPGGDPRPFDLALLDPPTFSNSKKMAGVLDVRRDHPALIAGTLALMRGGGALYFSTNARRFRLDEASIDAASIEDLDGPKSPGPGTIPPDFDRRSPHRCFRIVK